MHQLIHFGRGGNESLFLLEAMVVILEVQWWLDDGCL